MIKYLALVLGAVVLSIISLLTIGIPRSSFVNADSSSGSEVDIWWPTDGANVSGTQPFKAVMPSAAVESYDMYWQVDGGALVPMDNNYDNAPHKQATVDVTSWNWHGAGPYVINFVAKQNGAIVGQHSISIYLTTGAAPIANVPSVATTTVITAPAATSTAGVIMDTLATTTTTNPAAATAASVLTASVASVISAAAVPSSAPAPAPVAASTPVPIVSSIPAPIGTINVWWPTPSASISGAQPFKAVLQNTPLSSYRMFWSVDGGTQNPMQDSTTDSPHKQATVDVTSWNWQTTGLYKLTFTAQDLNGTTLATYSENITVTPASGSAFSAAVTVGPAPAPAPAPATTSAVSQTAIPAATQSLSTSQFYVDPNSSAAKQASAWQSSRPNDAAAMNVLAAQPTAVWFGDWNTNIYNDVHAIVSAASSAGKTPVLVAYNIPQRDCGGYSAGGASASAYSSWIGSFASAIGNSSAVVILEPDALAGISCLSNSDQATRVQLISRAVSTLKANGNTKVYIDAGHSGWVDPATMASRLQQAGISRADGFSLNVSNFDTTPSEASYGVQISQALGGTHFVIDTSRDGLGSNGLWCNPPGRAIGNKPTTNTGNSLIDAYLWIKTPGESDGTCNGGPSAGSWWPDYALQLVRDMQ